MYVMRNKANNFDGGKATAGIIKQIDTYIDEYKDFMGIERFPEYTLKTHEAKISTADSQGYEIAAAAHYQPETNQHTLLISTNLLLSKHLMFHEFTHMLDSELYVNHDKVRYAGLSGYTEYHASQVELLSLLGAEKYDATLSFSMKTLVPTFAGTKSVSQYVREKYNHAIELFGRDDFPADIASLKTALGVLHNYWGLRSICEMYSSDFEEKIQNYAFLKHIPTVHFSALNNLMHGKLDSPKIDLSICAYLQIIFPIIQSNKLA